MYDFPKQIMKRIVNVILSHEAKKQLREFLSKSRVKTESDEFYEIQSLFANREFKKIVVRLHDFHFTNENARIGVFLARSHSKLGDFSKACDTYESLLKLKSSVVPQSLEYEYGVALLRVGQYQDSIEVLETLFNRLRYHGFSTVPLIIAYSKSGYDDKAMEALHIARSSVPMDPRYIALEIDLHKKVGNRQHWNVLEKEILSFDWESSASVSIAAPLLGWLLKVSKFGTVRNILPRLPRNIRDHDQLQEVLALSYYYDGEYDEVLKICNRLIAEKGDVVRLVVLKANSHSGAKQFKETRKCFEILRKNDPDNALYKRLIGVVNTITGELDSEQIKKASEAAKIYNIGDEKISIAQKRVLDDLREKGIAKIHVSELLSRKELKLWEDAQNFMRDFKARGDVAELYEKIIHSNNFEDDPYFTAKGAPNYASRSKPSVISYASFEKYFDVENPFSLFFSSEKILQIAASYYDVAPKIRNVTLWINPPVSKMNQINAKGSQLWHRDQEDKSILKCFAYFSDIDENSGALQYVPSSTVSSGGKYSSIHPFPATSGYPGGNFISERVNLEDIRTASGEKGTLYFVDTNGFHRGGLVKENTRHIGAATYLRPFASAAFNGQTSLIQGEIPNSMTALQRHAIT